MSLCMAFAFSCARCHTFLGIWEGLDGCDVHRLRGTNQMLYGCLPATKDGVMFMFLKIAIRLANSISQNSFCSLEFSFYSYCLNYILVEFFESRSGLWKGSMCYNSAWWCMRAWVRKKAVQDAWSNNTTLLNKAQWRLSHSNCLASVNGWVHDILTQNILCIQSVKSSFLSHMKKSLSVSHSNERERIFRGLALLPTARKHSSPGPKTQPTITICKIDTNFKKTWTKSISGTF